MSAVRFEIKSDQVTEKRGTARASGKAYLIREQAAYMDVGKAYPVEVKINLNDLAAFKPGIYEIGKECFYVRQFGEVGVDLSHARLVQVAQSAQQSAQRAVG